MGDTEEEVYRVLARAMTAISKRPPTELLLADSSRAHLERATQHPEAGAPGCDVESPFKLHGGVRPRQSGDISRQRGAQRLFASARPSLWGDLGKFVCP